VQVKLSYKLFATFLLTSLMIVVIMIAVMQYYAARNFADYVNKMEMERVDDLVKELAKEYQQDQGWERLRHDFSRWMDLTRPRHPQGDLFPPGMPGFAGPYRPPFQEPPPPPPPPPWVLEQRPPPPPPRGLDQRPPPPPPPGHDPFNLGPRISLFGADKQPLVGLARSSEDHLLKAIKVNGKTVGWLGIKKLEQLSHPLDVEFVRRQAKAFYFVGGSVLLLAIFVSVFFSRHLLAPIRKLMAGTRALSSRRFNTRIDVGTGDELGQLAADFNQMAQAIEKYEQLRQQWISDISHELRTPLAILRGEIEALQDGIRAPSQDTLESLHGEVLHLSKIVNDLHDISLAEAGRLLIHQDPVDPVQVLTETLKAFRNRFAAQGITIQAEPPAGREHCLMAGDADRLKQIFGNILENTWRYAASPGVLQIRQELQDGKLSLNFLDSGPGVPEASLDRLFDRLYRVDRSRSRRQGGSGLGLAICKSLVQAMSGEIKARPAPSGGLWIEILFPLLPDASKSQGEP
jgi:two-component system sensor histidine kinase BaeS